MDQIVAKQSRELPSSNLQPKAALHPLMFGLKAKSGTNMKKEAPRAGDCEMETWCPIWVA